MKRIVVSACLMFFLAGCRGATRQMDAAYPADASYAAAPPPGEPAPTEAAPAAAISSGSVNYDFLQKDEEAYSFDDLAGGGGSSSSSSGGPAKRPSLSDAKSPPATTVSVPVDSGAATGSDIPPITDGKVDTKNETMIIYSGYLQLRVKRLIEAQDQIQAVVEKRGGYIDSLTTATVVVRIPGNDFEAVMAELAALGDLLNRWVRAEDVTEQFTDLRARLDVALKSRERLLKLLEKVDDVGERLRILQEIKRLSEQIDTIDSSLAAIRNLVDFFTITIDLVPILANEQVDTGLSPFDWVRALRPHLQTLTKGKKAFSIGLPKGFVLFDEEDAFRAQSADTSIIRAATVENEPKGDAAFWIDAVDFEMTTRQEKIAEKGKEGRFYYRLYVNDDVTPRFYLVALTVVEDKIYVMEVFFPNTNAKDTHLNAVIDMLKTAEVTP